MEAENKNTNNTGAMIEIGGLVIIAVAIAWWAYIYLNEIGAKATDAIVCLVSSSGECAVVNGLLEIGGHTPYTPILFWVGAAVWLIARMVKNGKL